MIDYKTSIKVFGFYSKFKFLHVEYKTILYNTVFINKMERLLLLLCLAQALLCQTQIENPNIKEVQLETLSSEEQVLVVQKTSQQMKIDGKADESSWQNTDAHSFDYFYKSEQPDDEQQSIFKMLWNESHLYFYFECTDKFITAREKEQDAQPYFDDCAEIFLIPTEDRVNMHFGFEVNLYKASNDFVFINDIYKNQNFVVKSYSPDFDVATTVNGTINDNSDLDRGWAMEMAIPINAFHTNGPVTQIKSGARWAFMAIRQDRNDATGNRRSTSTLFPLSPENNNVHNPKSFGIMEFVDE